MDLYWNPNPAFTMWVVEENILREPFVVVDVGCQGGDSQRWAFLREKLELHSFDPLSEVIEELSAANSGHPNKHYYNLALGDEDCEREFFVAKDNPYESSFIANGTRSDLESRTVSVRTLDSLFNDGVIGRADFLKVDVEGFEDMVLRGAGRFLSQGGLLGVEAETSLITSLTHYRTQFVEICETLLRNRFLFFDLAHNNSPKPIAQTTLRQRTGHENTNVRYGRPATFNVLFAIDHVAERDSPSIYVEPPDSDPPASVDRLIKTIILFELYGLCDCALDLLHCFRDTLSRRLDVETAVEKLMQGIMPIHLLNLALEPSLKAVTEGFHLSSELNDFFWLLTQGLTHGSADIGEVLRRWTTVVDQGEDLEAMRRKFAVLREHLDLPVQGMSMVRQEAEAAQAKIAEMRNSRSWRLTAPLRAIANLMRVRR